MNKEGTYPVCHSDNIEYGCLDIADADSVFYPCNAMNVIQCGMRFIH